MSSSVAETVGKFDVFLQLYVGISVKRTPFQNDSQQPARPAACYKAIAGGGAEVRRR